THDPRERADAGGPDPQDRPAGDYPRRHLPDRDRRRGRPGPPRRRGAPRRPHPARRTPRHPGGADHRRGVRPPTPEDPTTMKRLSLPAAVLLALTLTASAGAQFKDKNLEAAVKEALKVTKPTLADDDLAKLFVLEVADKKIADLSGLEKCKNLAQLNLGKNAVADVKPLAGLTELLTLDLSNNKVAYITPLAGLTKLQRLELTNNQVADLKPL